MFDLNIYTKFNEDGSVVINYKDFILQDLGSFGDTLEEIIENLQSFNPMKRHYEIIKQNKEVFCGLCDYYDDNHKSGGDVRFIGHYGICHCPYHKYKTERDLVPYFCLKQKHFKPSLFCYKYKLYDEEFFDEALKETP